MDKILKYKKYNFTLEEIQLLFFMEKASRIQTRLYWRYATDILRNKRKQLVAERDSLMRSIEEIEKEIESLPASASRKITDNGVPFSIIPCLYCPDCQKPLKLDSASLSNGSIQSGVLSCECGYVAEILNGIILCRNFTENTPFKAFENVESVMAMKDQFSPTYRKLITKTYLWIYNCIANQLTGDRFIMAGPFTFNFFWNT